jgi:prophage regulatory protein
MEPTRIIRKRELLHRVGYDYSTVWRLERDGGFPSRVRLRPNSVGWREDEISQWIKSRIRGGGRPVRRVSPSPARRRIHLYDD